VAGLGKEVEGLDGGELIAGGEEIAEVAHLRGGVAGNVDDRARAEGKELLEEGLIAAFAGRVDDHDGVGRGKREAGEDRGRVARLEGGVGDAVGFGVFARETHAALADLDAGDALEGGRGGQGEKAAAAVGVDEKTRATRGGLLAHVTGERGQDEGIVLEEIAGEEVELQVADGLRDNRVVVGRDDARGVAEEQRGAAGVGVAPGVDAGADFGELFVDGVGRDGTARDIDDVEARALPEKADREIGPRGRGVLGGGGGRVEPARGGEVGGDFRAVAELARRADDRIYGKRDAGHVLEQFGDLLLFPAKLLGVGEMLILAAAAAAEERATGLNAVGRRGENGEKVGFGEVFVITEDAGADAFAGKCERHHDDPTGRGIVGQRDAAEAGAEVGERGDLELDLLVIRERLVVERLLLFAHGTHGIHGRGRSEEKDFVFWRISVCSVYSVGPFEKITSLQNPRVKQLVKLRDRRPRDEAGVFLVEGYREIRRALEKSVVLKELYFSRDWFLGENEPALIEQARAAGAEVVELSKEAFAKVAYRERPDGLLAVAPQWKRTLDELELKREPFLLVVEAIEKPGNLGTILRSADAAGCDAVIVCDPVTDIFNPNVVRASTGVLFSVPLVVEESARVLAWLKEKRIQTVATTPAAEKIYSDVDLRGALAVVMGSEQYGLSDFWLKNCDVPVRIPMAGQADSLNVAMATIITLFEAVRQRAKVG